MAVPMISADLSFVVTFIACHVFPAFELAPHTHFPCAALLTSFDKKGQCSVTFLSRQYCQAYACTPC